MCNTLKEPKDGSVTITGNGIGDTATYTCNAGFELKGKDSRTCKKGKKGKDPKWKPRAPKCKGMLNTTSRGVTCSSWGGGGGRHHSPPTFVTLKQNKLYCGTTLKLFS